MNGSTSVKERVRPNEISPLDSNQVLFLHLSFSFGLFLRYDTSPVAAIVSTMSRLMPVAPEPICFHFTARVEPW